MAIRLIEFIIPLDDYEPAVDILKSQDEHVVHGIWHEALEDGMALIRVLIQAKDSEFIIDLLEKRFSTAKGFRVILFSVEATVPRLEEPEPKEVNEKKAERIGREELYSKVLDIAMTSNIYVTMVVLSSIVAAIGILNGNIAIIIGAMVIAPLLGPNVALSLATTLGDTKLARTAMKTNVKGITTALVFPVIIGLMFEVDPDIPEIYSRTHVGFPDVVLALASGIAASLSLTTGVSSSLIGVMVAVALLPPIVTLGMLLGSGQLQPAYGAFLLLLTNIIAVNLSGVVTFLAQGIRPLSWWEAEKAKRYSRNAIIFWIVLLVLLALSVFLSQH